MNTEDRQAGPIKRLRGKRLEEAAIRELQDLGSWRKGVDLCWRELAKRFDVSRQALEAKDPVVEAFGKAKDELKKARKNSPEALVRRTQAQRIEELELQLREKNRQLDAWIAKWVTVAHNCRAYGIDESKILAPLDKPNRTPAG